MNCPPLTEPRSLEVVVSHWVDTTISSMEVIQQTDPDTGELVLPLPEILFEKEGWLVGDSFSWEVDKVKGCVVLTNVNWHERQGKVG